MKRIQWIDDLKGLSIVLIVFGHVLATVRILSKGSIVESVLGAAFSYIYSFHVPLFFLLAGLTFSAKGDFLAFARRKFSRLMVPYFTWGMVSAALFVAMGHFVVTSIGSESLEQKALTGSWWVPFVSILHGGRWPDGKGFSFNGVLWFLPVLFLCELAYYPIAKRVRRTLSMVLVCSVIAIFLSPIYWPVFTAKLPYGITWVAGYLPYMVIGDWIGRVFVKGECSDERSKAWSWLIFAAALLLGARLCSAFSEVVRYPKLVPKALATIIPVLIVARYRIFRRFAFLAPHTIAIMLFHKFLLIPMQIVVVKSGLMQTWPTTGAITSVFCFSCVCVVVSFYGSKILIRYLPWSVGVR